GLLTGELDVDAPSLATLAAFALVEADGAARANLRFAPDGTRQTLTASFTGSGITYGPVRANAISGEARIDDAFGTPLVRGNVQGSRITIGSTVLDTARATATVENGATRFEATAAGPDLSLSGAGTLASVSGTQTVRIDRLTG